MLIACLDCGRATGRRICEDCKAKRRARDPYQSREWRKARKRARGADCAICGSTERLTAHHRQNRREGGSDEPENLLTLCVRCHSQYEADRRAGKTTDLTRLVEAM